MTPDNIQALEGDLLADPYPQRTEGAMALAVQTLESPAYNGNALSDAHREGLRTIPVTINRLFAGVEGRFAIALDTGAGKTTAIACTIAVYASQGVFEAGQSIAVASSHVEALCRLKRELVAFGVSPGLIGLHHSGRAREFSEPCDADASARPILLTTHAAVKIGTSPLFDEYRGAPRTCVCWDETMLVTAPRALEWEYLSDAITALLGSSRTPEDARAYIATVKSELEGELTKQAEGAQAGTLHLGMPEAARRALRSMGPRNFYASGTVKTAAANLLRFGKMAEMPLAIQRTSATAAVIMYKLVIPDSLKRVCITDASGPIRMLALEDKGLTRVPLPANVKRYENVTAHFTVKGSGRSTVAADVRRKTGSFFKAMVVECVRAAWERKESALVLTFKKDDAEDEGDMGHPTNFIQRFRDALAAEGLDPDHEYGEGRKLVHWLTFGNETSLNSYTHCRHVAFAGTFRRSSVEIGAHLAAQSRDIQRPVTTIDVQAGVDSEVAHSVYQGMSRGACRVIRTGQAERMDVYLAIKDEAVNAILRDVTPGMVWDTEWYPAGLEEDGKKPMYRQVSEAVTTLLEGYEGHEFTTNWLRGNFPDIKPDTWKMALKDAEDGIAFAWERPPPRGRTWTRKATLQAGQPDHEEPAEVEGVAV